MTNIMQVLEQRRIRQLDRSEQYTEIRENAARARGQEVRQLLSGKTATELGLPAQAAALRKYYYEQLSVYRGGSFAFAKPLNKRAVNLWMRVFKAWQASGVSPEQYIRSQFAWFHKAFGKAPTVEQLTTETAVNRASEGGVLKHNVVSNDVPAKINLADVFRQSEKMVQEIMRAQKCTREEFYRRFVLTGVYSLPEAFMKADPAYRAAKNHE